MVVIENARAADIELSPSDLREIADGELRITPSGDRYPPEHQRLFDR